MKTTRVWISIQLCCWKNWRCLTAAAWSRGMDRLYPDPGNLHIFPLHHIPRPQKHGTATALMDAARPKTSPRRKHPAKAQYFAARVRRVRQTRHGSPHRSRLFPPKTVSEPWGNVAGHWGLGNSKYVPGTIPLPGAAVEDRILQDFGRKPTKGRSARFVDDGTIIRSVLVAFPSQVVLAQGRKTPADPRT